MTFSPKPTTPPPGITKKTAKLITLEDLNNISPPPTTESQRKGIDPKLLDHITGGRDLSGEVFDKAFMAEFLAASERKGTPLFEARPASEWLTLAQAKPRPLMLFDSMWYQGDLCILFADTNVGKSILAVQIADSISSGIPIPGLELDAPAQPVAYLDFEMSDRQFLTRYSYEGSDPYPFSPGFVRLEQSMGVDYLEWGFTSFEAFLYHQMGHYIERTGTKVLIVDNLTFLHSETEKAKDASRLMNVLTDLKRKHDLSLLILAHTPKRDNSKPLEVNHLQGSKQIANLSDSIIGIGTSHKDNGLRYIKQIKHRMNEKKYEQDNVCLCQVVKPHNFLHFEVIGCCHEREHLKEIGDKELAQRHNDIRDLRAQGKTQREIAEQLGISPATVCKVLKR